MTVDQSDVYTVAWWLHAGVAATTTITLSATTALDGR